MPSSFGWPTLSNRTVRSPADSCIRLSPLLPQYECRVRTHCRVLSMPLDRRDYCGRRQPVRHCRTLSLWRAGQSFVHRPSLLCRARPRLADPKIKPCASARYNANLDAAEGSTAVGSKAGLEWVHFLSSARNELMVLWEDGGLVFCKGWQDGAEGRRSGVLVVLPASESRSAPNVGGRARA